MLPAAAYLAKNPRLPTILNSATRIWLRLSTDFHIRAKSGNTNASISPIGISPRCVALPANILPA